MVRKKRLMKVAAISAASVSLIGLAGLPADASSHREAPLISEDSRADNTDLYAFRDANDPTKLNIIANFVGLELPQGGPNFEKFGDDVKYSIHLDNNGDVQDDITFNFRFRTAVANGDTFLYNTGPIGSTNDANHNLRQYYSVEKVTSSGSQMLATDVPTPPVNIGPRSTPNYEAALAAPTVKDLGGGSKVFAGQRNDAFFADLGSVFDLLGLRPLNNAHAITPPTNSSGVDGLAGKNVHTIAMQVPINSVSKNGDNPTTVDSKDSMIGIESTTSRQRVKVLSVAGEAPRNAGRWVQVSRLGIPLVNEVLIPRSQKDKFNASAAKDGAQFFGSILDPEPSKLIEGDDDGGPHGVYPGVDTPQGGFNPDGTIRRTDIVAILTGQGAGLSAANALPPADLLRVNLAVAPTASGSENRLGILGADAGGFPNGRRLGDDVVDIELRLLAGGTPFTPAFNMSPNNALTDGVDHGDGSFLSAFPYQGTPLSGYRQQEPGNAAQ